MMNTNEVSFTTRPCPICGHTSNMIVDKARLDRWQGGELIQRCFPEMSKDQRELLITGTHPKCWDKMFADDK